MAAIPRGALGARAPFIDVNPLRGSVWTELINFEIQGDGMTLDELYAGAWLSESWLNNIQGLRGALPLNLPFQLKIAFRVEIDIDYLDVHGYDTWVSLPPFEVRGGVTIAAFTTKVREEFERRIERLLQAEGSGWSILGISTVRMYRAPSAAAFWCRVLLVRG